MANKPRSDSTLDALNPQQKELLRGWLVDENASYENAKERLWQDFHIRTSGAALSKFYATQCYALRSSQARDFAEEVVSQLTEGASKYDEATLALVKQKAFERAWARNGNLKELALLVKMLTDTRKLQLKEQDQKLTAKRLELLQFEAARAALQHAKELRLIASDSTLSDAERLERARLRLFGAAPEGLRPLGETHGGQTPA